MLKKYFKRKSKFSIAIDIIILVLIILLIIPQTRKNTAAFILKPTLIIHQPKVNKTQKTLENNTYLWQIQDINGHDITFSEFKNKVVFINVWATWCPPCIAEMGSLQKLYNHYKSEVCFLFISNDDNKKNVQNFLTNKNYDIPVYFAKTKYPTDFETNSLPTTFLISKEGKIIISKKGIANWNSQKIKNILDNLIDNKL